MDGGLKTTAAPPERVSDSLTNEGGAVMPKGYGLSEATKDGVWELRAEGLSDREIGRRLSLARGTVSNQLARAGGIQPRARRRPESCLSFEQREEISRGIARLWVYDFRTNQHITLKTRQMMREDLSCRPTSRESHEGNVRSPQTSKRWTYAELGKREGFNLDVSAEVEDKSLVDVENLAGPDVIAEEIVEQLTSALAQFEVVASQLRGDEIE